MVWLGVARKRNLARGVAEEEKFSCLGPGETLGSKWKFLSGSQTHS